jgi:hypothetical protein
MRYIIILLALAGTMAGQTVMTLTGPVSVRPGKAVTLSLGLTTSAQPAGLQWTAAIPAGWAATPTIGTAATAAQKLPYCSTDKTTCLVVGMNQTAIAAGPVATYAVTVPAGAPKGLTSIALTGLVAGGGDGTAIPVVSGVPYAIRVLAKHDLNGDGATDGLDLQLIADQVVGKTACADDQNGDGKCDLIDALLVIFGSILG